MFFFLPGSSGSWPRYFELSSGLCRFLNKDWRSSKKRHLAFACKILKPFSFPTYKHNEHNNFCFINFSLSLSPSLLALLTSFNFWPLWSTISFVCSSVCFNTPVFLSRPYQHVSTNRALLWLMLSEGYVLVKGIWRGFLSRAGPNEGYPVKRKVQGRGQCTWPLSGLVLQTYVAKRQSSFLTSGRFTLEFCRHRTITADFKITQV